VATPEELATAIESANDGDTIKLMASIESGINLMKLVNLDLNGQTLTGSVSISSETAGTLTISAGTITGDLTVNTPNATVNNSATVSGTTTIIDVAEGTWNELANGNKLVFNAAGRTLNIADGATVSALTIDAEGAVITIEGAATVAEFTANSAVTVSGAANIESASIAAEGVGLDAKPESIISMVDVTIGEETIPAKDIAKDAFYLAAKDSYELYGDETSEILVAIVGFVGNNNELTVTFKNVDGSNVVNAAARFFTGTLPELGVKSVKFASSDEIAVNAGTVSQLAIAVLQEMSCTQSDFNGGSADFTAKIQLEGYTEYEDNFKVTFYDGSSE